MMIMISNTVGKKHCKIIIIIDLDLRIIIITCNHINNNYILDKKEQLISRRMKEMIMKMEEEMS